MYFLLFAWKALLFDFFVCSFFSIFVFCFFFESSNRIIFYFSCFIFCCLFCCLSWNGLLVDNLGGNQNNFCFIWCLLFQYLHGWKVWLMIFVFVYSFFTLLFLIDDFGFVCSFFTSLFQYLHGWKVWLNTYRILFVRYQFVYYVSYF